MHFTLIVLCIIDNQFTTVNQKLNKLSFDIYIAISHWVFLHASIHKEPS